MTDSNPNRRCSECGGYGWVIEPGPEYNLPNQIVCDRCGGRGEEPHDVEAIRVMLDSWDYEQAMQGELGASSLDQIRKPLERLLSRLDTLERERDDFLTLAMERLHARNASEVRLRAAEEALREIAELCESWDERPTDAWAMRLGERVRAALAGVQAAAGEDDAEQ